MRSPICISLLPLTIFLICSCGDVQTDTKEVSALRKPEDETILSAPAIKLSETTIVKNGDIDVDADKLNNDGMFLILLDKPSELPIDLNLYKSDTVGLLDMNATPILVNQHYIAFTRYTDFENEISYLILGTTTFKANNTSSVVYISFVTKLKE